MLALTPNRAGLGEAEIAMPWRQEVGQYAGFLHAGLVGALIDTACGFAAATMAGRDTPFMRPMRNRADAMVAPVLPAEIMADARPSRTASAARTSEESFMVPRSVNGALTFEIVAVSRPRQILARAFPPIARRLQVSATDRYFQAMRDAVEL